MFKKIKKIYPQKDRYIYILFDISLLLYFIAYFYYFTDDNFSGKIRLFATGMVIIFGTFLILKNLYRLKIDICTIWYTLFVVFGISSMMWAVDSSQISGILITLLRVIIIGSLIFLRIEDEQDIEIILTLYVVAVIYMVLQIAFQMIDYYSFEEFYRRRFGDNFGYNSNMTAMQSTFSFLICFHKSKKNQKINSLLMIFFALIIILTGSKKGIFGLLFGLILYIYLKNHGVKKIKTVVMSFFMFLLAYELIMSVPYLYEQIGRRIETFLEVLLSGKGNSTSTVERMALIGQGIDIWIEHFFVGVGLNNFSLVQTVGSAGYYAHCNYIELLADLGIVGFLLFYSMPIYFVMHKDKRDDDLFLIIRTILFVILFFDIGAVTYQLIQVVVFYWIFSALKKIVLIKDSN